MESFSTNKRTINTWNNTELSQKHYVKWKKPDKRVVHNTCFSYGYSGKGKTIETEIRSVAAEGWERQKETDYKGAQWNFLEWWKCFISWQNKNVLNWMK